MWDLDYRERWVQRNWCFWTVVLEETLESPVDLKEIQPVHPRGNQSWIFTGRTVAEAETPILWPPDAKNWLIGKDPDDGKDWRQKGMTEDEMVGWHHPLYGHEFEEALGVGDGQGGLGCCSPWCHKGSDMTERLNWLNLGQCACQKQLHTTPWWSSEKWQELLQDSMASWAKAVNLHTCHLHSLTVTTNQILSDSLLGFTKLW